MVTSGIVDARYQVVETLGEGGMGVVYLVDDRTAGDRAALKVLTGRRTAEDILRFKQEFRALTRLHHPNLCEVRDYGVTPDGAPFFTMEVVPGRGLEECLNATPADVTSWLAQMIAALGYVHARGLVHADVKPENFRVQPDGVLKLMDFGLMVPTGQRREDIAGTIAYMAPEAAKGDRLDQRSDLYSLGAVLYELLTGRPPFVGATPLDVLRAHVRETPPPPRALVPEVPEALDRAIIKLLAKEPNARFASTGELAAALGLEAEVDQSARLLASSFVGRAGETARLAAALDALATGNGAIVSVTGGAGVGKSRLLDELRVMAQLAERPFAGGAGAGEGAPYAPFVAVARMLLPKARAICPADLAALAPALAKLLPELAAGQANADAEDDPNRLKAALARLIVRTLAAERGVLMLDAWDDADAASRDTLAYLVRNAAAFMGDPPGTAPRLLVVVASRNGVELAAEALALAGLPIAEVGPLAAGMLGQSAIPPALAAQLQQLTGGNPRMIAAVLHHAVYEGAIARAGGAWRVPDQLPATALTTDVRHLLAERLAPLGDDARAAARVAALLGDHFDLALLAAASGLEEAKLFDALDDLARAGVVDQGADGWRLVPAELREVLDAEIAGDARLNVHLGAAKALQARVDGGTVDVGTLAGLARHLLALEGEDERAARAASTAGAALKELHAVAAADGWLTRALERAERLPEGPVREALRIEALLQLGFVRQWRLETASAAQAFEEACALAEAAGDQRSLARGLASQSVVAEFQNLPDREIRALYRRAIDVARAVGDVASLARSTVNFGRWLVLRGDADGLALLEEAPGLTRDTGLTGLEARALASLGYARAVDQATRDQGFADMRRAIEVQGRLGDRYGEGFTRNLMCDVLLRAGRFEEARDVTLESVTIMREIAATDDLICGLCNLLTASVEMGELDRAAPIGREVSALAREHGHKVGAVVGSALQGLLLALRGEAAEAAEALKAADAAAWEAGSYLQAVVLPFVVEGWLVLGRVITARSVLQEAVFALRSSPDEQVKTQLAVLQAEVHAAQCQWSDAEAHADDAIDRARTQGLDGALARALLIKAMAVLPGGRTDDAGRLVEQAQAIAGRSGMRPLLALAAGLQGELAVASNPAGAMAHFQAMHALADDMGLPAWRAWALHGQVRALPGAANAAALIAEAQRTLRGLVSSGDEEAVAELEASAMWAEVHARNPAVAGAAGVGPEAGSRFAEHFQRVSADLQGLFSDYGALRGEWEASNGRLKRLNEVAGRMGETLRLDEVLGLVVALTLEITGAERGFVLLREDGRYDDLVCCAAFDDQGRPVPHEAHSLTISQRILAAGRAVAILDASADAEFQAAKSVVGFNLRTVMGVPLVARGRTLGALYVDSRAVVTTFTEADLEMLRGVAIHAANAIENARLYETLDRRAAELEEALQKYRQAEKAAGTDMLTGLANRRRFVEEADREIATARRYARPLAALILDVDHFKSFNDTYGHAVGDEVLKAVAACLPPAVRDIDLPARLGGEEFVVLCPVASVNEAAATAERVREAIAALRLTDADGQPVRQVTASVGVAELTPADKAIGDVLERADAALYSCKRGGRNQVQVWREGMTAHP